MSDCDFDDGMDDFDVDWFKACFSIIAIIGFLVFLFIMGKMFG